MRKVKIFISYDHRDTQLTRIVWGRLLLLNFSNANQPPWWGLFKKYEVETWIDALNIPLGTNWRQEITKGIASSAVVVLVASTAHYSPSVAEEISIALAQAKPILPLYADSPTALDQYQLGHLQGYLIPRDLNEQDVTKTFEQAVLGALDTILSKR